MSISSLRYRPPFADHFRLVHDISLDNIDCQSDEELDKDANSSGIVGNTTGITTFNYLENTFSINLKNATNLLHCTGPVSLIDSHPSMRTTGLNALRIEDVGKLHGALPDPECTLHRVEKSLKNRHHVWSSEYEEEEETKRNSGEITNGNTEVKSESVSTEAKSNLGSLDKGNVNDISNTPSAIVLPGEETQPHKPQEVQQSTRSQSNSVKRRRRPRKLPEIPTNSHRRNVKSMPPLTVLVNFRSLADELQEADPGQCHPSLNKTPKSRPRSHCFVDVNDINWKDLGSPEHVDTEAFRLPLEYDLPRQDNVYSNDASDSEHTDLIPTIAPPRVLRESQHQSNNYSTQTCFRELHDNDTFHDTAYSQSATAIAATSQAQEFCDRVEFIDDELRLAGRRHLDFKIDCNSNTTADVSQYDHPDKKLLQVEHESSPEGAASFCSDPHNLDVAGRKRLTSSSSTYSGDLEDLNATHRGCHKFIPRHANELFIEIGDPIYVELEADDLWCEGVNMRTGKKGIFPAVYATDLDFLEGDDGSGRPSKFTLKFLGSVKMSQHTGTEALCQAIHKVAAGRRATMSTNPPPTVCLEVNEYGLKITEKEKKSEENDHSPKKGVAMSVKERLAHILNKGKQAQSRCDHFFNLKNVSFCGYHPRNEKYFAFVTKHPLDMRFACHVLLGHKSTKSVAEAVGTAFKRFYQEYMAFVHPTEDIYLE